MYCILRNRFQQERLTSNKRNRSMKKFIVMATCMALSAFAMYAQNQSTYNQTCALINSFESIKTYTVQTTTPLLSAILEGVVEDNCVYTYPGLKYRLVGNVSKSKLNKQSLATANWIEGDLLYLLYYSRQNGPSAKVSDKQLAQLTKDGGTKIIKWVRNQWNKKELNYGIIDTLQDYRPETACVLIDVIAQPYWSNPAKIPELTQPTQASRDLWQIYFDARLVELAKRSVVVRLLAEHGDICIPTVTYAGTRPIYLDPVSGWSAYDIDGLYRILDDPFSDPWYCEMAAAKLHSLGYWY